MTERTDKQRLDFFEKFKEYIEIKYTHKSWGMAWEFEISEFVEQPDGTEEVEMAYSATENSFRDCIDNIMDYADDGNMDRELKEIESQ